eukprot:scpid98434/ scgid28384/ 
MSCERKKAPCCSGLSHAHPHNAGHSVLDSTFIRQLQSFYLLLRMRSHNKKKVEWNVDLCTVHKRTCAENPLVCLLGHACRLRDTVLPLLILVQCNCKVLDHWHCTQTGAVQCVRTLWTHDPDIRTCRNRRQCSNNC